MTTFCDGMRFTDIDNPKPASFTLPSSSPHLVAEDHDETVIYFTCQDTASNNLMVVNMDDVDLNIVS